MAVSTYDNQGLVVSATGPIKSFGEFVNISTSTAGAAYFRIGNLEARRGFLIHVCTTGGSYTPGFTKFFVQRSWTSTGFHVTDIVKSGAQYTTHARMSSNNSGGQWDLDIYFNAPVSSQLSSFAQVTLMYPFYGCEPDGNNTLNSNPTRNPTVGTNSNTVTL